MSDKPDIKPFLLEDVQGSMDTHNEWEILGESKGFKPVTKRPAAPLKTEKSKNNSDNNNE